MKGGTEHLWAMLSPWNTTGATKSTTPSGINNGSRRQEVYREAKLHWCASLLYEIIRKGGDFTGIPETTCNQLRSDCLANRLRNQLLTSELSALLQEFVKAGLAVVLLKGAATFADDLYGSRGARTMLDLDLLVRPAQIETARALLVARGYEEIPDEGKEFVGIPADQRHAHINGYRKPGTPVLVELHYNIAYGQGGRILSAVEGWLHTCEVEVDGAPALVLEPTYRLLHNTVHGLIPSCDYIKGKIRLWHLLEFAYLVHRYSDMIDWQVWLGAAAREKQTTAFLAWLLLANRLLAVPLPEGISFGVWSRLHARRLANGTLLQGWEGVGQAGSGLSWLDRLCLLLHRGYYYLHLPGWVWRNVCYAEGWRNLPVRVRYFLTKMLRKRSWAKI